MTLKLFNITSVNGDSQELFQQLDTICEMDEAITKIKGEPLIMGEMKQTRDKKYIRERLKVNFHAAIIAEKYRFILFSAKFDTRLRNAIVKKMDVFEKFVELFGDYSRTVVYL